MILSCLDDELNLKHKINVETKNLEENHILTNYSEINKVGQYFEA